MMSGISRPVRRLAAGGIALALLAGVAGLAEPLVRRVTGAGTEVVARREQLGQLIAITRAAPAPGAIGSPAAVRASAALYLDGKSEAIQLASLQAAVRRLLEAEGLRPRSAQTLPSMRRDGVSLAGLRLNMDASLDQLQRLLIALEGHRPLLIVDGLDLVPREARETAPHEQRLQVDIRVLALVRRQRDATP